MMRQVGFCSGIENYSRHIDGRSAGRAARTPCSTTSPRTSCWSSTSRTTRSRRSAACTRATCPASGCWSTTASGCRRRMDNRPLKWEEFLDRIGQTVYLSATPGPYELGRTGGEFVEQVIRPTGLVDPEVVVKPTKGQIDDLVHEIRDARREGRAGPGHHADQEDVRGPHRLPARARHPGALPALRGRHAAPGRAAAGAAAGRVRRAGRHQPAARGPRPARGVAGLDPGRRQGGLPALRHVADPDDRPRRPQRLRPGPHVRGQDHPVDGARRSTRPTGGARSRSRYNEERGLDPQPLRKRIVDILDGIYRRRRGRPSTSWSAAPAGSSPAGKAPVPGLSSRPAGAGRAAPGRTPRTWPGCRAPSWPT